MEESETSHDFLIGRQQILDRELNVFGYELLFRDISGAAASTYGLTAASNQIIADSLLEHGLERIIGPHMAFINFTRENLLSEIALLLPKDRVVIEILEDTVVDDAVIEAVRHLDKAGYTIALDDFVFTAEWLPLIKTAKIIKFDIQLTPPERCRTVIERLSKHALRFLAEKVETREEFQTYLDLGCHYFQGYFFNKPSILQGKRLGTNQLAVLQLLAKINDPDIGIAECAEAISLDVTFSYKLLRYINSAYFSLPRKIESLRYALTFMGFREIRRWASLLLVSSCSEKHKEVVTLSLVRAKMCESLAARAHFKDTDHFFLVGLMSTIDHLLNIPLEEALADLPFSDSVKDALLHHKGPTGTALACTTNYEYWRHSEARFGDLTLLEIGQVYLDSVAWAYDAFKSLTSQQT